MARIKPRNIATAPRKPKRVRKVHTKRPRGTTLPYVGNTSAPVYFVIDPVVGNLNAKTPLSKDQMEWFGKRAAKHGGFKKQDVCIISASPPLTSDQWQSGKQTNDHLKEHRDELIELIKANEPKFIVPFGAKATQQLVGRAVQITKVRGQPIGDPDICFGIPMLPMVSPFFAQRQPENEAMFTSDMQTAGRIYKAGYDLDASAIDYKHDYQWCYDLDFLIKKKPKRISLDVEGVGLQAFRKDSVLLTVQFCWAPGKSVVVPINYDRGKWRHHNYIPWDKIDRKRLLRQIRTLCEDPEIEFVGQNLKFDWLYLKYKLGIEIANYAHDTQLLAHLHDENQRKINLDDLVRQHVPEMAGFNDALNLDPEHQQKTRMDLLSPDKMLQYAAGDPDATIRLTDELIKLIKKDTGKPCLWDTYNRVTMPAQRAFCHIEQNGFPVSRKALTAFEKKLRRHQKAERIYLLRQIPKSIKDKHKDTGVGLKPTRQVILKDWLYTHPDGLRLKPRKFTKTGEPSTSSKLALPFYVADHPVIQRLIDYIKNDKMLNTYAKGFHKYIVDDMVRPSYGLAGTVTGRSMCFVAGTQVTVLDERGSVGIESVKPGDWVWGFDKQGRPTPTEVTAAFETKTVTKLAKVVYRTQGRQKTKVLKCTPDHRFRLRDGSYVEAQNLEAGHRLMSLEREVTSKGYRRVYATGNEAFFEHRAVAGKYAAIDSKHVHHVDSRKLNNRPDNLEPLTPAEHVARHPWSQDRRGKVSSTLNGLPLARPIMRGKDNPRYYEIDPEWIIGQLERYRFSLAEYCRANGRDYTTVAGKFKADGYDPADAGPEAKRRYQARMLPEAREAVRIKDAARILKTNFYEARELLASDNNHEVLRVEIYDCEPTPVYDITTPETSCFVANGVCVHNSRDPNGQNFPKRGKLAKEYRKIFEAPPGWCFVACDLSQAELRIAAMMSGDPTMLKVYADGGDIHAMTAAGTMGLSLKEFMQLDDETRGLKRFQAKAVNFGFLYGMWWVKFREYAKTDYGIDFTEEEAKQIREDFFNTYPMLEIWHREVMELVMELGYIRTFDGRIRHLPNVYSPDEGIAKQAQRQAINSPVQSIGSDLGLMSLGRMVPYIREKGYDEWLRPCGFIHDAIVCLVREDKVAPAINIVKRFMENNPLEEWFDWEPEIPIITDAEIGRTLAETIELDTRHFQGKNKNASYKEIVAMVQAEEDAKKAKSASTTKTTRRKIKLASKRSKQRYGKTTDTKKPQGRSRKIRKAA